MYWLCGVWSRRAYSSAFLCQTEVQRCLSWLRSLFDQAVLRILTDLCWGQIHLSPHNFSISFASVPSLSYRLTSLELWNIKFNVHFQNILKPSSLNWTFFLFVQDKEQNQKYNFFLFVHAVFRKAQFPSSSPFLVSCLILTSLQSLVLYVVQRGH